MPRGLLGKAGTKQNLPLHSLGVTLRECSRPQHLSKQPATPPLGWQSFMYVKEITFCKPGTSEDEPAKTILNVTGIHTKMQHGCR